MPLYQFECQYVGIRERKRERERQKERKKEREREREREQRVLYMIRTIGNL